MEMILKIGTSTIVNSHGLDVPFINDIARQVVRIKREHNIHTTIVSSGAIASGKSLIPSLTDKVIDKQVAAMFGQPEMISTWRSAFREYGIKVGEVLYKDQDLDYARNPLLKVINSQIGIVIANGNDVTYDPDTEEEIISYDNDMLSEVIADRTRADLLVMLTDAEGILDGSQEVLSEISQIEDLHRIVFFEKTKAGTGGPKSKLLEARRFIANSNRVAYIAGARIEDVIIRIAKGERVGTRVTLPLQGYFNI